MADTSACIESAVLRWSQSGFSYLSQSGSSGIKQKALPAAAAAPEVSVGEKRENEVSAHSDDDVRCPSVGGARFSTRKGPPRS